MRSKMHTKKWANRSIKFMWLAVVSQYKHIMRCTNAFTNRPHMCWEWLTICFWAMTRKIFYVKKCIRWNSILTLLQYVWVVLSSTNSLFDRNFDHFHGHIKNVNDRKREDLVANKSIFFFFLYKIGVEKKIGYQL